MRTYAWLSLALYALWLILVLLRVAVMRVRSGTTGIRPLHAGPWSAEGLARALFFISLVAGAAAPLTVLTGHLGTIQWLRADALQMVAAAVAALGITLTTAAQFGMGRSWRIGVDPSERTELVTEGPFAVVRNPIYSAMCLSLAGFALLIPNALSLAAVAGIVVAVQLQVRGIEEPYMVSVHGTTYQRYAARVGRFVPGVGTGITGGSAVAGVEEGGR